MVIPFTLSFGKRRRWCPIQDRIDVVECGHTHVGSMWGSKNVFLSYT